MDMMHVSMPPIAGPVPLSKAKIPQGEPPATGTTETIETTAFDISQNPKIEEVANPEPKTLTQVPDSDLLTKALPFVLPKGLAVDETLVAGASARDELTEFDLTAILPPPADEAADSKDVVVAAEFLLPTPIAVQPQIKWAPVDLGDIEIAPIEWRALDAQVPHADAFQWTRDTLDQGVEPKLTVPATDEQIAFDLASGIGPDGDLAFSPIDPIPAPAEPVKAPAAEIGLPAADELTPAEFEQAVFDLAADLDGEVPTAVKTFAADVHVPSRDDAAGTSQTALDEAPAAKPQPTTDVHVPFAPESDVDAVVVKKHGAESVALGVAPPADISAPAADSLEPVKQVKQPTGALGTEADTYAPAADAAETITPIKTVKQPSADEAAYIPAEARDEIKTERESEVVAEPADVHGVAQDVDPSAPFAADSRTAFDRETFVAEASDSRKLNPAETKSVLHQVAERLELLAATKPRNGVVVHLDPKDLGSVTLVVKGAGKDVQAEILASNDQVRQAIEASRGQLQQNLEARGLNLSLLTVSTSVDARSAFAEADAQQHAMRANSESAMPRRDFDAVETVLTPEAMRAFARKASGVDLWI